MKNGILFLFCLFFFSSFAQDYDGLEDKLVERIIQYHSDIYVLKNTHVRIVETITVNKRGARINRGIYRDLPLSYEYKGGNVRVGFELLGVKRNGKNEAHHTEKMSNGIRIYAGSEDVILEDGVHQYEFSYEVHHVLGYFEDYDEIYWNVNGNGWEFKIDSVSANVYYPEGAELIQFNGYTGAYGDTGNNFTAKKIDGGVQYCGTQPLTIYENLTVAVAWDKNRVTYPTAWEEFLFWLKSYSLWVICAIAFLIGLMYNYVAWRRFGRDPKPGTIIPLFYPPEGMSPAECVQLKNNGKAAKTQFAATLGHLATKGWLRIEVEKEKGQTRIIREKNEVPKKDLNTIEQQFFDKLLKSGSITIKKRKYNSKLRTTYDKMVLQIQKKQKGVYYILNHRLKGRQNIFPFATIGVGYLMFYLLGGSYYIVIGTFVLQLAVNMIFSRLYEQPTKEGRALLDKIDGFIMYMKYANKERIRLMNPPSMNFTHYEENLPYAIALGVAEEWGNQFDAAIHEESEVQMSYIVGASWYTMKDFSSNLSSTISSASTPPSSSGSGSSFSGGGSSGGGGGGGGGGGW